MSCAQTLRTPSIRATPPGRGKEFWILKESVTSFESWWYQSTQSMGCSAWCSCALESGSPWVWTSPCSSTISGGSSTAPRTGQRSCTTLSVWWTQIFSTTARRSPGVSWASIWSPSSTTCTVWSMPWWASKQSIKREVKEESRSERQRLKKMLHTPLFLHALINYWPWFIRIMSLDEVTLLNIKEHLERKRGDGTRFCWVSLDTAIHIVVGWRTRENTCGRCDSEKERTSASSSICVAFYWPQHFSRAADILSCSWRGSPSTVNWNILWLKQIMTQLLD